MFAKRFLTAGLLLLAASAAADAAGRPNIVLLLADDLGYGEIGPHAPGDIPTPNIDALARAGVRFSSGYVTASYCSPSRAGLLTGQYQTRFGHEGNPTGEHNFHPKAGLPLTERTLAHLLKEAGYATALIGKWHLGAHEKYHPQQRGFETFYGFLHEGHFFVPGPPYKNVVSFLRRKKLPDEQKMVRKGDTIYATHMSRDEPPYDRNNPILRGRKPVHEPTYLTDALSREAVAFIDQNRKKPFFLCLAYNAVHSPMQGASAYMKRFRKIENLQRRVFAAMLANLDDSVGAVMNKLRETGLEENTIVFFLSDNGGPTRELTSSNAPLRDGKGSLYEGGIRVPFLMQWKAKLPGKRTYDKPVSACDVMPTLLAAAGIRLPPEQPVDGVDLLPHLRDGKKTVPHTTLYWRMMQKTALRQGDWKIVAHRRKKTEPIFELYDLKNDLSEKKDLSSKHPDKLEALRKVWQRLDAEMVDPLWSRN